MSLFLKNGSAWVDDDGFLDGEIEFDVVFTGERGFMGAGWRQTEPGGFEHFYLRPHQSGNPDATQYTPVFNGVSGWQLYHGEGYGANVEYPLNRWIHARIVIAGGRGEVYIDSEDPVLVMHDLKREPRRGRVGLTSFFAPGHFSAFAYKSRIAPF